MNIAWFTHRYWPCIGGAENYGREIVRRFVAAGHWVDVITSDALELWYFTNRKRQRVEAPREQWVDGALVRRLPIHHVPLQRYLGKALSFVPHWPTRCRFSSYMPIIPEIEQMRGEYDAVFSVGFPYTVFSFGALQTARAAGAPLLITPFLHLSTPGDPVNKYYTLPHQIRLLSMADTVITPTQLEADAVHGWGIPRERLLKLPMAVDLSRVTGGSREVYRQQLGIGPDQPLIGQLGALHPNKGTNDLVRAVARLNATRPAHEAVALLLAGWSSPEFESFLAEYPESERTWLKIIGPIDPERPDFYAALDVFAMPSRTDSFGIVYLEAWANALPVVAAAAGGVTEVVDHERTGLLVPFGDLAALTAALDRLLTNEPFARQLGKAGQTMVAQGYSWDDRFQELLGHTERLVAARRHPASPLAGPHRMGARSRQIIQQKMEKTPFLP